MSAEDDLLLEMAAKAEGRPPPYDQNGIFSAWVGDMVSGHWWDPLHDDGDALRLALALSFDLVFDCLPPKSRDAHRTAHRIRIWALGWHKEDFDNAESKGAAVRRTIVRAAAEIGRAMP